MWTALLSLFCFCLHGAASGSDKLLLVHALWRHGDRNPQESFPSDPNKHRFPEGFGSLTDIGAKQHKELGQWLKKRYINEYRLVSSKYDGKYVYVRSTNVSRTINSAKNNMIGMFNTVPNNKIPVEPRNKDKNLLPYSSCERSLQYRKMIERTDTYKNYVSGVQPLLDRLSKLSGKEQPFWRLNMLTDTLSIEKAKGMEIPKELNKLYKNATDVANKAFRFYYGYEINDYAGENYGIEVPKSLGGPLLQRIIDRMERRLNGKTTHKYVGYSAHDTSIMNLFSTFGFKHFDYDRDEIPSYASAVLIELWQKSPEKVPYVKVFYRRDKQLHELSRKISGCENGCTLSQFKQRSKLYLVGNVDKFCTTPPRGF